MIQFDTRPERHTADRNGHPDDPALTSPHEERTADPADPTFAMRLLLTQGYDPLDLEFMPEAELRELLARHAAEAHLSGLGQTQPLEQVVRSLLTQGYDPLDLEFMPEAELRELLARHAAGIEVPPCPDRLPEPSGVAP